MSTQQAIIFHSLPNAKRIKFHIPYNAIDWRILIKAMDSSYYHSAQKLWSVINTKENLNTLKKLFGEEGYTICQPAAKPKMPYHALSNDQKEILALYTQKLTLKSYSTNTIKTYRNGFIRFLTFFNDRNYNEISKDEIEGFIYHLIQKHKISDSFQNSIINAIKFYYEHILNKQREYYNIQRPKKAVSLPNTLAKDEVLKLLSAPENLKHKCILTLIYSAGLRISEVLKIRIEDIHSKEMRIFIKGAKGKKDRYTVLSEKMLHMLRKYYVKDKPAYWLFEGAEGGQYSTSSIQKIFRKAANKSRINPWATPHTLRHSFATHLLTQGVSLRYIQCLLGHQSSKTTEIYTHVMYINNKTVRSPLDNLVMGP